MDILDRLLLEEPLLLGEYLLEEILVYLLEGRNVILQMFVDVLVVVVF